MLSEDDFDNPDDFFHYLDDVFDTHGMREHGMSEAQLEWESGGGVDIISGADVWEEEESGGLPF